jgi:hypothetical protein
MGCIINTFISIRELSQEFYEREYAMIVLLDSSSSFGRQIIIYQIFFHKLNNLNISSQAEKYMVL